MVQRYDVGDWNRRSAERNQLKPLCKCGRRLEQYPVQSTPSHFYVCCIRCKEASDYCECKSVYQIEPFSPEWYAESLLTSLENIEDKDFRSEVEEIVAKQLRRGA
jgi:hypothetical protein